jgi:hypothetical protein
VSPYNLATTIYRVIILQVSQVKRHKDTMMRGKPKQNEKKASPPEEALPIGVGRVPDWWMEITPHYTLDLEQEEARRALEDQMAFYYSQMAAADDAGILGPDGKPKLGSDGKPLTSSTSWGNNGWKGRAAGGTEGAGGGATGPGGRKFAPGTAVINPSLFGIDKSDPDYDNYLNGSKLPPGYFEKMAEFSANYNASNYGQDGMANNLAQTDYGRYGRQAETPAFQPAWAKLKLRSTKHGTSVRNGVTASPEKTGRRVLETSSTAALAAPPPLDEEPLKLEAAPKPEAAPKKEAKKDVKKEGRLKKMVRKVRKVKKKPREAPKEDAKPVVIPAFKPKPAAPPAEEEKEEAYVPNENYTISIKAQPPSRPAQQASYPESDDEYEEEEIIEEEIIEEYEEEIIEEEIIEDEEYEEPPLPQPNLSDLQAILAGKQAELMRLQAQY